MDTIHTSIYAVFFDLIFPQNGSVPFYEKAGTIWCRLFDFIWDYKLPPRDPARSVP